LKSIASAPGKIILFGEHFVVYGVKAILGSISKRVTVTSSISKEKFISIKSELGTIKVSSSATHEEIDSPLKPFVFIAKKIIDECNIETGIDINIDSEIPPGIGLGSSSACCVAGAASISGLCKKLSNEEILELAINAERTIFEQTSGADCTVSTYGGIIEYDKEQGFRKINFEPKFNLVIANSKKTHSTNVIVSKVRIFKEQNEEIFSSICKDESKLIESVNLLLKSNDMNALGKSMSENQTYLERIGVSDEMIQSMIKTASETSFGAKITGAGGGGCIISLTDKSNSLKTIQNLKNNHFECFSVDIDSHGLVQKIVDD